MPTIIAKHSSSPGKSMPSAMDPPITVKNTPFLPFLNSLSAFIVIFCWPDSSQYASFFTSLSRNGRILRIMLYDGKNTKVFLSTLLQSLAMFFSILENIDGSFCMSSYLVVTLPR